MFSELDTIQINEAFLKAKDQVPNYTKRHEKVNINGNVIAVLKYPDGHIEPHITFNLVVTTGANYYAQLVGQITPTNAFDTLVLTNGTAVTPVAGDNFSALPTIDVNGSTTKAVDGTYPRLNDPDAANTGRGEFIFTWRTSYLTTDFNTDTKANITMGMITLPTPSASDPILNFFAFGTPFAKPSTAALVVWVNHTFVGA